MEAAPVAPKATAAEAVAEAPVPDVTGMGERVERRVPMTRLRATIAKRLQAFWAPRGLNIKFMK